MVEENDNKKNVSIYEIDNKKYTVISTYNVKEENVDKLYEILCKYIISQIDWKCIEKLIIFIRSCNKSNIIIIKF